VKPISAGACVVSILVWIAAPLLSGDAFPSLGFAQSKVNPAIFGTWKLNLAKSVYQLGPPPKTQRQVYEPFGDGLRVSVETITDNGARIAYGYAASLDGQEHPITGELTPNGATTIALRVRDSFIIEATLRRGADVVLTTRIVLSQDGTMLTITSKGTNLKELPTKFGLASPGRTQARRLRPSGSPERARFLPGSPPTVSSTYGKCGRARKENLRVARSSRICGL
jgi:hypothetical protein